MSPDDVPALFSEGVTPNDPAKAWWTRVEAKKLGRKMPWLRLLRRLTQRSRIVRPDTIRA